MPGLDRAILDTVDFVRVIERIKIDVRTDFVLAPHFNAIYVDAADELCAIVEEQLRSGNYQPAIPCTISVPKGRGFVRPGSILEPIDRVVYQLLIDAASPQLENQLDRTRTFSHVLSEADEVMFESAHECWVRFQNSLLTMCENGSYIVKADIANYFERIPQHHLINLMSASGCSPGIVNLMDKVLSAFQEKNSAGIIQGVFASDMLGNFFLSEFDAYCDLNEIDSARYVDDVYMAFGSKRDAEIGLANLIEDLRKDRLHLNEYKSGIHAAENIVREETEVDGLFQAAREEAEGELTELFESAYGFATDWDFVPEPDDQDIELAATQALYESIDQYPDQADKISRFCLPLLRAARSDIAVESVIENLAGKPQLTRLYYSYLSRFVHRNPEMVERLGALIRDDVFVLDYQRMFILGALFRAEEVPRIVCNTILNWLQNTNLAKEARAMSALIVAKFGSPTQKRAVRTAYEDEPSIYVKSAILYSTKYFTPAERNTCRRAWGAHSEINALLVQAMRKAT